jgi:hypothetical protein
VSCSPGYGPLWFDGGAKFGLVLRGPSLSVNTDSNRQRCGAASNLGAPRASPLRGAGITRTALGRSPWRTRSDACALFPRLTAAEITVIRDECRQANVVVAASFPPRLRHHSATVLQCLRHGLWGGGSGGPAAMSGPLALFQNTVPANRDVTRRALGGPGATTKLEGAPPRCVGGDCGWAGRAGEPLLGG